MSTLVPARDRCAPADPTCWCGERGWSIPHTESEWWLCESGHEFYSKLRPRPDAVIPFHIDPTLIAKSMPYANYIETGTRKPSPYVIYGAA